MVAFLVVVFFIAATAATTTTAGCLAEPPSIHGPVVRIRNGTVVGSRSGLVESFRGIPFAQPPVGALRLRPPQTINRTYGTITATSPTPTACPQLSKPPLNVSALPAELAAVLEGILKPPEPQGEDCLTLSVYRPSGTTPCSRLPVALWIYGGGWEIGSTQSYDGTNLVNKSIHLGHPMVFVAVNYRLGAFGFLAGKALQREGSTNLGLRDQRLAMHWVRENIESFGGDLLKVTILGESAGAISVLDHLVINNGCNLDHGESLFRGAIMDSGSILPAQSVASSHSDTLACLRDLPYPRFRAAAETIPGFFGYESLNPAYVPRFDPNDDFFSAPPEFSIQRGHFAKVPIIIGDQEDEGTLFSLAQANISSSKELTEYFTSYYPETGRRVLADLVSKYPDYPSAGSPFRTGHENQLYRQYKRLAAILGDLSFQWPRRVFLSAVAAQVPAWSYLSSYLYGTPVLGTFHASDILGLFDEKVQGLLSAEAVDSLQTYYISFINHLDPNALSQKAAVAETVGQSDGLKPPVQQQLVISDDSGSNLHGTRHWPRYHESERQLLNFRNHSNGIIADDFREEAFEFYADHLEDFRL